MATTCDVIVIGLGAMGTSACRWLAGRGLRAIGLERFTIGHDRGSSHGHSRVIRKAYFEDSRYVPLLHSAYTGWEELGGRIGRPLIHRTGCLNLGPAGHAAVEGARASAVAHGLAHETLDAREVGRRWPEFRCHEDDIGVYEEDAGFLVPEACIAAQAGEARRLGAELREEEAASRWEAGDNGVRVETSRGVYEAGHLVITAGPWLPQVAPGLGIPLRVERQVQAWFVPRDREAFRAGRMPVFIYFVEDRAYYGIPIGGQQPPDDRAVKVARHHGGATTTADEADRVVGPADEEDIRWYLRRHLPGADGPMEAAKVCLYTNTPDDHFVIDRHPAHPRVLIAGGFSGHGFKFAPVVGEVIADLVTAGATRHPIGLFAAGRPTS